jgi:hypothetical protein
MKEQFYSKGPFKVSLGDFSLYEEMTNESSTFDKMYYIWINENYPDGVRRLALRDMLRQEYGSNYDNPNIFCRTNEGFGRIFYIGGGDKKQVLYWTLFNRPKLLAEIVSEFMYNLENKLIMPIGSMGETAKEQLIEFLITLVDETTGRKLLAFHPLRLVGLSCRNRTKYCLHLRSPQVNMPEWLRGELWSNITSAISSEIENYSKVMAEVGYVSFPSTIEVPALEETITWLVEQSYSTGKGFDAIISYLQLLEEKLPKNVKYFGIGNTIRVAPKLEDEELALKLARRHIFTIGANSMFDFNDREGKKFLRWLWGLIVAYAPDDGDFFDVIVKIHHFIDKGAQKKT